VAFEKERDVALAAATAAGQLIREQYVRFVAIPDAPADISTAADRDSQELILREIRRAFPDDALCAEESTETLAAAKRTGPRLWIVDPIDGSRGFATKNGEFCVMIAFVHDHRIEVGVVLEPATERVTFAIRGGGCWQQERPGTDRKPCRVGKASTLETSTLVQSRSRTAKASPVVKLLTPARVVETFSAGVKLARVATGDVDLYANVYPAFHDWDICAGHILVEEAGGRVTTLGGSEIRYGGERNEQRGGMLASNGSIHQAALDRLQSLVDTV
jgi:3'(2'), 5'-bisphosphate nucleotidase